MLTSLGARAQTFVRSADPFTNVYGLARTLLASAAAITLLATPLNALFRPLSTEPNVPGCHGLAQASAYCIAAPHLSLVRWVSFLVLLLVASGYRPRITGVLHSYVALSFSTTSAAIEGGDQIQSNLALLLLPVTLLDGRKWHWDPPLARPASLSEDARRLVARFCFALMRLQVAGIYFHAAVGKWGVEEWGDGTVLYYWFAHPSFGAPAWLRPLTDALTHNGAMLAGLTWSVVLLEFFLAAGIVAQRRYRPFLFWSGIALHLGIALIHGLMSFATVMWAALILYLLPIDVPLSLKLPRRRRNATVATEA
jgi:antimicrobial peptide system SdpB family protein